MKKLFFTIFLSIIYSSSFAQWELNNPIPTDANLTDIFYVDNNNGWAVGEHGTILFTNDGGQNWVLQLNISGPFASTFRAVYFTDLLNGWAVGSTYIPYGGTWSSLLYHTNDGGNTWENQYSAPTESFSDVWFVNPDTGWVVGDESYLSDGIILYTEDGGVNWEEQYRVNFKYLSGICFTDSYNGCAVGAQGHIVNTSNGGETWEVRTSYTSLYFTSVCFTDLNNGWAIGIMPGWPPNAKIIHTEDGGNSWEVNYEFGNYEAHDVDAIFFVDANNGWLSYRIPYGTWSIMHTSDGGETWNTQHPEMSINNLPTLCFIDSITGWAVGENIIINTSDGGQNWLPQNTIAHTNFNSICLVDDSNAWAAGSKYAGSYSYFNTLVHTTVAGVTWMELGLEVGVNFKIMDMCFIDENHGWLVRSSPVHEEGIIGRTVDGGLNWEYTDIYMELSSVYFIDSLNGWVVGPYGTILHTMNGGIDWVDESMIINWSLLFNDVFFTDLSNGWIIGTYYDEGTPYGKVYYTNNGGSSWEEQYSIINTPLIKGCFIAFDKVWVIGDSIILHTSDGGINWQQQTSGVLQLNSIYFTDEDNGWAVGNTDIIHTIDGGLNWNQQTSEVYNNLNCVAFIDNENGWIVGNNGVMLHTNNGGTVGYKDQTECPILNILVHLYPNPFTTSTTIEYELKQPATIQITIYNHFGKLIEVIQQTQSAGKQQVVWNAEGLPAGVYFCVLKTHTGRQESGSFTKKMIKL